MKVDEAEQAYSEYCVSVSCGISIFSFSIECGVQNETKDKQEKTNAKLRCVLQIV
jgi:hypothetical protein